MHRHSDPGEGTAPQDYSVIERQWDDQDQELFRVLPVTVCATAQHRHSDLGLDTGVQDCSMHLRPKDGREQRITALVAFCEEKRHILTTRLIKSPVL
jgi:hypothetical protein